MRHVRRAGPCAAALLCCVLGRAAGAAPDEPLGPAPTPALPQGPEILVADLRTHLEVLACDAYEGRATIEEGGRKAAEYVAAAFARAGLRPLGAAGSWFQPYLVPEPLLGKDNLLTIGDGPGSSTLQVTVDWNPVSVTPAAHVKAELVCAGFGISAPKQGHDDYAGLDVKGKVVLLLRKAPRRELGRHASLLAKVVTASRLGAVGVLLMNDAATAKEEGDVLLPWNAHIGGAVGSAPIPFAFLTRAAVARLLGLLPEPLTIESLEAAAATAAASKPLGIGVTLVTSMAQTTEANARNVVGFLPGRDPEVSDEVVVLGAHHDHVGRGGPGSLGGAAAKGEVHNGADDNGSGTAALLELADWFAVPANRPRRSLVFLSFSGEELGLLGSAHYVEHPLLPLSDTVAMVNLDMVGRCRQGNLEVGGVGTAKGLQELVAAANVAHGLTLSWDPQGEAPSDSTSFFLKKIPVLFLFTGLHPDYHRPADDIEKICFDDLQRITRLTRDIAREIAEREERLVYTDPPRAPRRAILGVEPSPEPHPRGVALAGVIEGGPAAQAGMQAGDVLLSVGGQSVRKLQDLQQVLRKLEPGKAVAVVVLRDGAEVTVSVTLAE